MESGKLFAVYSKWSKRICWMFIASDYKVVQKYMSWQIAYFRTRTRFAILPWEVLETKQIKDYISNGSNRYYVKIPELSDSGKVLRKRKLSIVQK